jgi:hypothetical protein
MKKININKEKENLLKSIERENREFEIDKNQTCVKLEQYRELIDSQTGVD